ncbi:hypothetical protein JKP88DRAFT_262546 [Tribonema minus]|uniref:Uncharacterized protein n=1 Tax=Tribonema minus TaxID=303371 RepID=A0A835Z4P8_9STRA|nr:hypothetical protein JKP88DRAFT_262546 [Tribonema minus]
MQCMVLGFSWLMLPRRGPRLLNSTVPGPSPLTPAHIKTYNKDGVVLVKGLFAGEQLNAMVKEGEAAAKGRALLDLVVSSYKKLEFSAWSTRDAFAQAAFNSSLPSVAQQLLGERTSVRLLKAAFNSSLPSVAQQLLGEKTIVRLLKDALFQYASGRPGCGWHVDDFGFWPAEEDTTGVTVWVALSPMRVKEGGGIMVAKGTHHTDGRAPAWVRGCRDAIRKGSGQTCRMAELAPECVPKLDAVGASWDMEPGDAVIWDRWSFHRSMPFADASGAAKLRYSVRYIPSDAKAAGYVHASVPLGQPFNSSYHPQVWPAPLKHELRDIRGGKLNNELQVWPAPLKHELRDIRINNKLEVWPAPLKHELRDIRRGKLDAWHMSYRQKARLLYMMAKLTSQRGYDAALRKIGMRSV